MLNIPLTNKLNKLRYQILPIVRDYKSITFLIIIIQITEQVLALPRFLTTCVEVNLRALYALNLYVVQRLVKRGAVQGVSSVHLAISHVVKGTLQT